jgi:hypothetical protein
MACLAALLGGRDGGDAGGPAYAAGVKYRVRPAVVLVLASQQAQLNALIAVMVFGLVVGVFGHIIRSRTLILTGIIIIGGVSAYFLLVTAAVR